MTTPDPASYLYEVAEDVYLARTGSASTNGIAAVVDAIEPLIRREVLAALRAKADECSTVGEVLALINGGEFDG